MKQMILLAALALALAGCASLNVQVDVLQPAYLRAAALDEDLRIEAHKLANRDFSQAEAFVAGQKTAFLNFRTRCLTDALNRTNEIQDAATRAMYATQYTRVINSPDLLAAEDTRFERLKSEILDSEGLFADRIQSGFGGSLGAESVGRPIPGELRELLLQRRAGFTKWQEEAFHPARGQKAFCASVIESLGHAGAAVDPGGAYSASSQAAQTDTAAKAAATDVTNQTILGGAPTLLADAGAFDAVAAPSSVWAPRFNKAFGQGFGGNTDVAFRLNSTGDFSVKGFVFDGRSTADMVSKVGVQAASIVAQAYGIPVGGLASSAGGAPAPTPANATSGTASQDMATIAAAQADDAAYRTALFHIADLVLIDPDGLKSGNAAEAAAVKSAIDANAPNWPAATPAKPAGQ